MSKLKQEELTSLQEAVNKVNTMQIQIGGLEAQKHALLHSIAEANNELGKIQEGLQETYGDVSIDITTGDIKENESSKED
jgi:ribosomal protein S9